MQDIVLDRSVTQIENIAGETVHLGLQRTFLARGDLILAADRGADIAGYGLDLTVSFVDPGLELHHFRIVRLIDAELLLIFCVEKRPLFRKSLDRRVLENVRQGHESRVAGRPPAFLSGDTFGARPGQGGIEGHQVAGCQGFGCAAGRCPFARLANIDDLLVCGIGDQLPFG